MQGDDTYQRGGFKLKRIPEERRKAQQQIMIQSTYDARTRHLTEQPRQLQWHDSERGQEFKRQRDEVDWV